MEIHRGSTSHKKHIRQSIKYEWNEYEDEHKDECGGGDGDGYEYESE